MNILKKIKMSYFTIWDINLFLCLVSLGISEDLAEALVKKIRRVHRSFELERVREFHCDRGQFVDMTEYPMIYFSRSDLVDQIWHFPKAVSNLESIPVQFYQKYSILVEHFTEMVKHRLVDQRITYFRQYGSGEEDIEWSQDMIKWFEGFHPGRFLLMDQEYINSLTLNSLIDLLWRVDSPLQFVKWYNSVFEGKKHIEDLL